MTPVHKSLWQMRRASHLQAFRTLAGKASAASKDAAATAAATATPPTHASREKHLEDLLRPVTPPPPRPAHERQHLRDLMIRYGKLKRSQHIESEIKKQEFLRAKWAAIDALPHLRRVEAIETKPTEFPLNRPLFTDTPPIKGFNKGDLVKS